MVRTRAVFGLGFAAALLACVPGGPIYIGPPVLTLRGHVFTFETREPIANAEVCAFSADTLCLATDRNGNYRVQLLERQLLEGGRCTLRFRAPGFRTHVSELSDLVVDSSLTVDCGITNRVSPAGGPATCLTPAATSQ